MTDKEVGEMWAYAHDPKYGYDKRIADLVCKLVEERILRYEETSHMTRMINEKDHALREFGIDPKTFPDSVGIK